MLTITAALSLALAVAAAPSAVEKSTLSPDAFSSALSVDGIMSHLQAFAGFAAAGVNRAHGTSGYNASADYVAKVAEQAGLKVSRQSVLEELGQVTIGQLTVNGVVYESPTVVLDAYTNATEVGGSAGELVSLPGSGCEQEDFAGTDGKVVLVMLGECDDNAKVFNSMQAKNLAIILYGDVAPAANPYVEVPGRFVVPVVLHTGISTAQELLGQIENGTVDALVNVQIESVMVPGDNVVAQTSWGSQEKVIMFGAHLDSVQAGPGINDNGSGSATLLEMVKQLANFNHAEYAIRFGWWAAEERGLHGSKQYVQQLSESERDQIAAYINLDMTGSPNYKLGVQDNSNSAGQNPPWISVPAGSVAIERILQEAFRSDGQNSVPTPVSSASDHASFMAMGIPSGYLESGAGARKTALEAELFGGVAGERYDSCYHQLCDNMNNVSPDALIHNARAAGRAMAILANDISAIEEEQRSG